MQLNNPFVQEDLEFYRNEFLDLAQKAYKNLSCQYAQQIVDFFLNKKPISELNFTGHSYNKFDY